jgi:hypothetical protein
VNLQDAYHSHFSILYVSIYIVNKGKCEVHPGFEGSFFNHSTRCGGRGGQSHTLTALPPGKRPVSHSTRVWLGRSGCMWKFYLPAYEDVTDWVFRNVGIWTTDTGESPRRRHTACLTFSYSQLHSTQPKLMTRITNQMQGNNVRNKHDTLLSY